MSIDLHLKYRPQILDAVLGQDQTVKSLQGLFDSGNLPHAFLFTGSSGVGKTTISRILATMVSCRLENIIEINAATSTGIDGIRDLTDTIRYTSLSGDPKFIIMDECHKLTSAAWEALLKPVEEPPAHVYFCFATTEPDKVPIALKTRCHSYILKDIIYDDLMDLIEFVYDEEHFTFPKNSLEFIARASNGSFRQALVYLQQVSPLKTLEEIKSLLQTAIDSMEALVFCRLLFSKKKPSWTEVSKAFKELKDIDSESLRIIMMNYYKSCALNSRSEDDTVRAFKLLEILANPFSKATGNAEMVLCLGRYLFTE